jgi:hypothetical protein
MMASAMIEVTMMSQIGQPAASMMDSKFFSCVKPHAL